MFCRQCGTNNPPATNFCTSCGARISGDQQLPTPSAPAPPASQPGGYQAGGYQAGGYQQARTGGSISIDFRRLGIGDYVALGASVLLFISLFLTWYSANLEDDLGNVVNVSTSALGQFSGGFRFLILVMAILILIYLFARALAPRGFRLPLPHWQVLTVLLAIQFLLTLLAFLLKPNADGSPVSWEYGAYIGLVAAVIAVGGGIARKNEPEVIVPGAPHAGFGSFGHSGYSQSPQPGTGQPAAASGTPQSCPQCAAPVPVGSPYCPSCGSPAS